MNELRNKIEALLFASGKNMDIENVAALTHTDVKEVLSELKGLKEQYDQSNGALMILEEGAMWKIHVRESYLDLVSKIVADTELGKAVLETLAVVAYRSPVFQADVIKIRSGQAYEHIAQLCELGFIVKEKSGRTYKLRVTDKFYEYFDMDKNQKVSEVFEKLGTKKKIVTEPLEVTSETQDPDREITENTQELLETEGTGSETEQTEAQEREVIEKSDEVEMPRNEMLDELDAQIEKLESGNEEETSTEEVEEKEEPESESDEESKEETNSEEKDLFEAELEKK